MNTLAKLDKSKERLGDFMKVILLDNIKGVGKKDEVINASDGYARNFLFPKKLAVEANSENMSKLNNKKEANNYRKDLEKQAAEETAKKLKGILLKVNVKAGENGKIFGGVTAKEIADTLKTQANIEVDKKKIELKEQIKTLGTFSVNVKLYEGVTGVLKIDVIAK